jgi:hypothetical protein
MDALSFREAQGLQLTPLVLCKENGQIAMSDVSS